MFRTEFLVDTIPFSESLVLSTELSIQRQVVCCTKLLLRPKGLMGIGSSRTEGPCFLFTKDMQISICLEGVLLALI